MDAKEFADLFQTLSDGLYRVARYILEDEADAEDAVQDLFLKLWASRETLDNVHNLKAYCITLMRNSCIDRIRKAQKMPSTPLEESLMCDGSQGGKLLYNESLSSVVKAMGRLSESQRTVLKMKVFDEMSYDEIEEKTGMNKLTLRVLLSQARSKLKKAYYEKY